jgi:hypothetical protein
VTVGAKSDDLGRIKQASEDLQNAFHALSQQLYAQQQPAAGGNGHHPETPYEQGGSPDGEDVVEGEFREA